MSNAEMIRSMRERFLDAETEPDRYSVFADMAEAYVANTLEAISGMDAANPAETLNPVISSRLAQVRSKLEDLDDLIVRLRELQAEGCD